MVPSDGGKLDCDSDTSPSGGANVRDGRSGLQSAVLRGVSMHAGACASLREDVFIPAHSYAAQTPLTHSGTAQRRGKRAERVDSPSVIPWRTGAPIK